MSPEQASPQADGPQTDKWHRWLRELRHGGDSEYQQEILERVHGVRDEVLDRAGLQPNDTLLDVGTGDGLIAFGALDRLGATGHVIFSDISMDLLDHCRSVAAANGQLASCDFLVASADRLDGIADGSVDVVTTRSVLIYVADKDAAFAEFRRVLRPGGRISLHEPINVLMNTCDPGIFFGYSVGPVAAHAGKITRAYDSIQPPQDPMGDFDERDLVRFAEQAGFGEVNLDLRVTVKSWQRPTPWEVFLRASANPLVPPLGEIMNDALSPEEAAEFTAHLRPLVESGIGVDRLALAYLSAVC